SSGEVWSTPVNEAAPSLMASVLPVTVTDIVFAPVVVATRYQISESMPTDRVLVAFVNAPPFHEAEVIVPLPPTSCQMSADRTMIGFDPVTVCVQVFVIVPLKPVVMLVVVASNAIVEVDD